MATQFTSIRISDFDGGYVVIHQTVVSKEERDWKDQLVAFTVKIPVQLKLKRQKIKSVIFFKGTK